MNRLKLLFPICALGFLFFACEAEPVEEAVNGHSLGPPGADPQELVDHKT